MCFWFDSAPTNVTTFQADKYCRDKGGLGLAPYFDDKQYDFIEALRVPQTRRYIYIGVMDVGNENVWTHLDGTPIYLNKFITTFDIKLNQPNGGTLQNCATINEDFRAYPNKTQDKDCHELVTSDMICYRNILDSTNCYNWTSPVDNIYREHCYWVQTRLPVSESHTIADAMRNCRNHGGTIAPLIDSLQYAFVFETVVQSFLRKVPTEDIWIGTHGGNSSRNNWSGDPMYVGDEVKYPSSEKCLAFTYLDQVFVNEWKRCSSNRLAVVCYKSPTRYTLPTPVQTEADLTTQHETVATTSGNTYASTVKSSFSNVVPVTIGPISMEEMVKELSVNPKQTNAYRLSKISIYEDRPTAKAIGGLGIGILVGIIAIIAFLDCQRTREITKNTGRKEKK